MKLAQALHRFSHRAVRPRTTADILYQCVLIGSGVLFIDQATKHVANRLGMVSLNPGISFGIFASEHPVISFLMLLVMGVIISILIQQHWHKHPISTGLFVGGAISNLVDRIARGAVRDWLPVGPLPLRNNIADWAIFVAAILVLWNVYQEEAALHRRSQPSKSPRKHRRVQ
jgi:signal peptidase II